MFRQRASGLDEVAHDLNQVVLGINLAELMDVVHRAIESPHDTRPIPHILKIRADLAQNSQGNSRRLIKLHRLQNAVDHPLCPPLDLLQQNLDQLYDPFFAEDVQVLLDDNREDGAFLIADVSIVALGDGLVDHPGGEF